MTKNKYILYLLWLVGAFLWLYLGDEIYLHYKEQSMATYELTKFILISNLIYVIDGLYFGGIVLIERRFSLNKPLLIIVALPTLLLGVISTLEVTFETEIIYFPLDYTSYILRLFGMSLIIGMFNNKR